MLRRIVGPAALFAFAFACVARGAPARAQSCCSSTSANEFAVVGQCNYALLATRLGYQYALGSWDEDAHYRSLAHARAGDLVWSLGAGLRLPLEDLQIHGSVPIRLQHRQVGDAPGQVAVGFGDPSLYLRWTSLKDTTRGLEAGQGESFVPFLDLFFGAKAPLGTGPAGASALPVAAGAMGNGVWELVGGFKVSKYLTGSHVLQLIGRYSHRFGRELPAVGPFTPHAFRPGDEFAAQLGWIQIHSIFWSWGASFSFQQTLKARDQATVDADFVAIPGSETRRIQLGGYVTHALSYPELDLTLDAAFDPPIDRFGRNVPFVGPSVALSLRYNFIDPIF